MHAGAAGCGVQDYGCGQSGNMYFVGHPAAGYNYIFLQNARVRNKTADERKLTRMNKGGRWLYLDAR